jgi:acyl-CoA synthetase (AMP-forming)/AMP-acid ligase II
MVIAVYTGVNPAYTKHELVHHLSLTRPKLFIVEPQLLSNALAAADEVGLSRSCIYAFDVVTELGDASVQSWDILLNHGERDWVSVENPGTAIAQYASTSGTSGLPKAAMLPHSYHVTQGECRLTHGKLPYEPIRLTALPPFHVFATPIIPSSIREGITTYVMRRFDMQGFVAAVEEFKVSETYLPPPCLVGLPQQSFTTRQALDSLRQIWFGGASLKYGNQLPLYALLHPEAKIQPVWGMTEAGWITAGRWEEKNEDDSVGRSLPCFEVK